MSSSEPDPEAVFSQQRWTAIAQSIGRDEIPKAAKQEICCALFEFTMATIGDQSDPPVAIDPKPPLTRKPAGAEIVSLYRNVKIEQEDPHRRARTKADGEADERETLEQFVVIAREFRAKANRIRGFLGDEHWYDKVGDLTEEVYQLQSYVDRELERRPKSKGGRPSLHARDTLVRRLALVYQAISGKKAGRSENPKTGKLTGPFARFVSKIFQFHGISSVGIKHAIAEVAKNLH